MAYPPGLLLRTVQLGPLLNSSGKPAKFSGFVSADTSVHYDPSDVDILNDPLPVESVDGVISFRWPRSDQPFMSDGRGNSVTDYTSTLSFEFVDSSMPSLPDITFNVPTGATTLVLQPDLTVTRSAGIIASPPSEETAQRAEQAAAEAEAAAASVQPGIPGGIARLRLADGVVLDGAGSALHRGPEIDWRDFDIRGNDDDFDDAPGLNALFAAARAVGGTALLSPDVKYYAGSTLFINGNDLGGGTYDQSSVRVLGKGSNGSLLAGATKRVEIFRPIGTTHLLMYGRGRGQWLENITLNGQGTVGDLLQIDRGFEFMARNFRAVDAIGTGMDLRALSNAKIRDIHVDRCGSPIAELDKTALVLRGNASNEYASNATSLSNVHLERNRGVDFDLGWGADADDAVEFTFISDLHTEFALDSGGGSTYKVEPSIRIGNSRGAMFSNPYLYTSLGGALVVDRDHNIGTSPTTGITFSGGYMLGHLTSHAVDAGTPDRLVDLVHGDGVFFSGVTFDTAKVEAIRVRSTFGSKFGHVGSNLVTRTGAANKLLTDDRTENNPARGKMLMAAFDAMGSSKRTSSTGAIIDELDSPAGSTAGLRMDSDTVARWDVRKSSSAETGSNAGSDLEFVARADDGSSLGNAMIINRRIRTVSAAAGFVQAIRAGAPSDADWTVSPPDGTTVLDTTNGRLYLRTAGVWKYTTLT